MSDSGGWLAFVGLVMAVIFLAVLAWLQSGRIDGLEDRMTTFETVRIEAVAPAEDSG